jgi:hypothetical protein
VFCDGKITPLGCLCPYKTYVVCEFCDYNIVYLKDSLRFYLNGYYQNNNKNNPSIRVNKTADDVRIILNIYLESLNIPERFKNGIRIIMKMYVENIKE